MAESKSLPVISTGKSSATDVQTDDWQIIAQNYHLRDESSVLEFLRANPEIVPVVVAAHGWLTKNFGPDTQIDLEVTIDPEDGIKELFGYIHTTPPVDEALAKLDKFDTDWFLDQIDVVGGKFNFNLYL